MRTDTSKMAAIAALASLLLAGCTSTIAPQPNQTADAAVAADPSSGEDARPSSAADTPVAPDPRAAEPPVAVETQTADSSSVRYFADERGRAIRGTDPVAYFTQGRPVAGREQFSHTWSEATWWFASADNRDRFAANPEQYAPQYGGFCAWAVSQGYTAAIDPQAWAIVDGKLYLNYSPGVQRRWERDVPGNIAKADANWPGVLAEAGGR